ncbi:MAG TPA: TetR/AcrR family transcriptional regulator [Dehalococcoidia bacterium]|nr:TetR/AcrR family transcriptional regulator [Dehalococcoidia bacterium]
MDPPRRARQRADRRQRLLAAGLASFADLGFAQTTVRNITERADLGHGTFYQYFQNKEDLLRTLIAERIATLASQLRHRASTDALTQDLQCGILDIFRWFEEHRGVLLALQEAIHLNPTVLAAWEPARTCLEGWLASSIEKGEQLGLYRGIERERAVAMSLSLLIGVAYEAILSRRYDPGVGLRQLADDAATFCANALFRLPDSQAG